MSYVQNYSIIVITTACIFGFVVFLQPDKSSPITTTKDVTQQASTSTPVDQQLQTVQDNSLEAGTTITEHATTSPSLTPRTNTPIKRPRINTRENDDDDFDR